MGGYVKNIHATNIKAGSINLGVLGIETDVLYQWKALVPTYEIRLTPIQEVHMKNIVVDKVKFISRILAQKELPVKNVSVKNITTGVIGEEKYIHKYIENFYNQ